MRTLTSYLLLPRPKDAVKWWILPLTFGLGVLARGGADVELVARATLAWAVLELLVYQARYQWNDIRGFTADQRHPDAAARGRLPGPEERGRAHIRASALFALARVAAAAALALLPGALHLGWYVAALIAGVFGVALLYEYLRSRATGRDDRVPPPVTPAIAGLWVVVGGGYAVRGVAGLALAVDLAARPGLALAAGLTMWAFGIAFVTGRWSLEALAFAHGDDGRVAWRADAGQAREHTLALARWLPERLPAGVDPRDWRVLVGRTPASAPWNLAFVVAASAAAVTGVLLSGSHGIAIAATAAALGGLLGALVARACSRAVWVSGGGLVLAAALATAGVPRPLLAALPWVAIAAAHALFAAQSLATLGRPLRSLAHPRPAPGAVAAHG